MVILKKKTNSSIFAFQLWNDSFKLFVREVRKDFQTTKKLSKTEMDHDEVDYNNYKIQKI